MTATVVGYITYQGEGNALRAAAAIKKEKPAGTHMEFRKSAKIRGGFDIILSADSGRELVVQQYIKDYNKPDRDGVGAAENQTGFHFAMTGYPFRQ